MKPVCLLLFLLCLAMTAPAQDAKAALQPVSGRLDVGGGSIYYETLGEGPALVLIHGGFGDRRMWDAQFREFARRYRVVRYDHRGFGKSMAPQAAYSPTLDLLKLLDHLWINKAHLIGNSMGGTLALDFALKHPERVSSIVVVASGARGYPHYPQEDIDRVIAVFRAAQEKGVKAAAGLWLAHPMVAVSSKKPGARELLEKMVNENSNVFLMNHWPNEDMKPAAFERLGEVKSPVLIVVGDRDTPAMQAAAKATAKGIPGAEIVVMKGADHLPQMTDPPDFNRIVAEFLSRKG